ncbi:MAG TPA: glutaredoxin family protein [Rhodanobacteraceae bacterium]|nr:glutaredoxin family protein [Rhodanobacteraceae bacterium]
MRLIFYQRDDCPLCDQAMAVLAMARAPDFEHVWIDDDAQLEALYGERVPVLRDADSGAEIGWPFDPASLRSWLRAAG